MKGEMGGINGGRGHQRSSHDRVTGVRGKEQMCGRGYVWTGFSTEIMYEDRQGIWGHVWGVDAGDRSMGNSILWIGV